MLELGVSQAQAQFTKLLTQTVVIVDKKAHQKKAVILPYDEYINLVSQSSSRSNFTDGSFNKFVGVLDSDFESKDLKYREIVK